MSNHHDQAHGHAHHGGAHDDGVPHGSLQDYVIGFVLSVVLTAIPFWLVMTRPLPAGTTVAIIMALAAVQIVVHMIYFLHMSPRVENGWSITALVFTIIVVAIALSGSLWVMYNLNANMMPMPTAQDMRQMP